MSHLNWSKQFLDTKSSLHVSSLKCGLPPKVFLQLQLPALRTQLPSKRYLQLLYGMLYNASIRLVILQCRHYFLNTLIDLLLPYAFILVRNALEIRSWCMVDVYLHIVYQTVWPKRVCKHINLYFTTLYFCLFSFEYLSSYHTYGENN